MSDTATTPQATAVPAQRSAGQPRGRAIRSFRPDIEGLRAVAVSLVVLSHLGLGCPGGYVGVDVFFVISGFLITRQLFGELSRTGRVSIRAFYARRVRRILPAATVVIAGTMLAIWKWDSPLQVRPEALNGLFAAFSGLNWRLAALGSDYFALGSAPSPFQHFWSLAVEEQFYLVWPALLLLTGRVIGGRLGRRKSVVWALLAVMAASLTLSITTTVSGPSWAYFGTQTRAWELALGALLAVTVDVWTRMPPALASQMSWAGLGMIALSAAVFSSSTVFPGVAVVLPVVGSAFVIAGGCPGWPRSGELLLRQPPLQFLGRTSYSWYLVHWPVLTIVPLVLGHGLSTAGKWAVLAGSLALAVVMYYLVEQPVRTWGWVAGRPARSLALGGVLILVAVATTRIAYGNVVIPGGGAPGGPVGAAASLGAVERAVAAGAQLRKLPYNVSPPLPLASKDHPRITGNCLLGALATTPPPAAQCAFGDRRARRTMAIVGDSHANQWAPALDAFGRAARWRVVLYAKAACPPGIYPTYIDPQTNRIYKQCNQWRSNVFAALARTKPKVVLVTAELRTLDVDPSGMVAAIQKYQVAGARVIYLEDSPSALRVGLIPDCLARHAEDVQDCSMARKAPTTRLEGFVQRRIESDAARRAGATVISPVNWFCTAVTCPPVINKIVVYSDNSHITATYARWLSPVMTSALERATRGLGGYQPARPGQHRPGRGVRHRRRDHRHPGPREQGGSA
jgi:peptidoglycan/LPS O-acetylase OafA/YrhL